ncbi:CGNR zinc finger domain-containing protein [Streptomyces kanamyceticus]|uniref:Zf-CGNR multi-domain protein n=1 Tax=Streptomyces kanamyceticus TaxID=1967 RepID=A0A5J6GMU7_STRKN|nr:CGNR zinc finger domain-containing protein [Streptomyces kanamyceticus]QEU96393.1 zf-CGNR multi-domain protein [Streptomyces kanamyceticus]
MTWSATERYRLEPAPGGLGLVQDLLNTVSAGLPERPDLLADLTRAQTWTDGAVAAWASATGRPTPTVVLADADADGLRELRDLRDGLAGAAAETVAETRTGADAGLRLGADGVVHLEPRGTGAHLLVSLVLAAVHEAQQVDTRRRLKTCRNPLCRVAFYDRSRNNSGVWHDVKTCGNAANLRAYRARRRERAD